MKERTKGTNERMNERAKELKEERMKEKKKKVKEQKTMTQ